MPLARSQVFTECAVYIGHADNDRSMPPEQIQKVAAALDAAHVTHTAELYEGALHGWTMSDLPAYNKEAEEKHWERLLSFFERTLLNGHG